MRATDAVLLACRLLESAEHGADGELVPWTDGLDVACYVKA